LIMWNIYIWVLMEVTILSSSGMSQCNLVDIYWYFRGMCCLYLQGGIPWRWRLYILLWNNGIIYQIWYHTPKDNLCLEIDHEHNKSDYCINTCYQTQQTTGSQAEKINCLQLQLSINSEASDQNSVSSKAGALDPPIQLGSNSVHILKNKFSATHLNLSYNWAPKYRYIRGQFMHMSWQVGRKWWTTKQLIWASNPINDIRIFLLAVTSFPWTHPNRHQTVFLVGNTEQLLP
jgi:hypothetical protein